MMNLTINNLIRRFHTRKLSKQKTKTIWLLLCIIYLWACDGNSENNEIPSNIKIDVVTPDGGFVYNERQWVRISPNITFEGGQPEDVTYLWQAGSKTISTAKDLMYAFAGSANISLSLTVRAGEDKNVWKTDITVTSQAYTQGVTKVFDYKPAPGQFINDKLPAWEANDTQESMKAKVLQAFQNDELICLGGFGGYIVMGFDHTIINVPDARDFVIPGNGFYGNAEPGIIMVSVDMNNDGIPNDPWYEIAGSAHVLPGLINNYEITYTRPEPLNSNVPWSDNQGNSGFIYRNNVHRQVSYFPLWMETNTLTFSGTLLPSNVKNTGTDDEPYWVNQAYEWGYADNQSNTSEAAQIDIDWAVDSDGNKVYLQGVDFVKVYTGINQHLDRLGETSTEISGLKELALSNN